MLKNSLLIALRRLSRRPGYAALNVMGLAIGLAASLLLLQYVSHELSFDRYHANAERVFRVASVQPDGDLLARVSQPVGPLLEQAFPEVEASARLSIGGETLVQHEQHRFYEGGFVHAEPAFFRLFDVNVHSGVPLAELDQPFRVFVTESAAAKYFGDADPVGQVLRIDNRHDYEVAGVLADPPSNSHVQYDFLASYASLAAAGIDPEDWYRVASTYVLLRQGTSPEALHARAEHFKEHYVPDSYRGKPRFAIDFTPVTDIRLAARQEWEPIPQSDTRYVALFALLALLILGLACVNYMNLATAHAADRAREVGMRKSIGATRRQLAGHFLAESVLVATAALLVAVPLAEIARPWLAGMLDAPVPALTAMEPLLWAAALTLAVGLLAGSYPAFVLSGFQPATALKSQQVVRGRGRLRQGLVVAQFTVGVGLIATTLIIHQQMRHMQAGQPDTGPDQVIMMELRQGALDEGYDAFRSHLLSHATVRGVTRSSFTGGTAGMLHFFDGTRVEDGSEDETHVVNGFSMDEGFAEVFGLDIVEGRPLRLDAPADREGGMLINEAAARAFGWEDPVGKRLAPFRPEDSRVVVGVVGDFFVEGAKEEIRPALFYAGDFHRAVAVRVDPYRIGETLAFVGQTWDAFVPQQPFDYAFLDDQFAALYHTEIRLQRLMTTGALLAILVAALGLFGLAAFTAQARTKEVGLRKVLGASVSDLVALLSRDFLKLVVVAVVLAVPLAWWATTRWLEGFAYRIDPGPGVFMLAGGLALAVALLTVSYHALRAASRNPVETLRAE